MSSPQDGSFDESQDSDYDGAWKELLRSHLGESLSLCFPNLAELIDWTHKPQWLDKEISQIIGQSGHRNREVDLLFKIRLIDGRDQWILCHLEIQTSYEAQFAFRLDLYNAGLKWMFRQDVLTMVILADLKPDWRPCEYRFNLGGFGSDRRFPVCKVLDRLEGDWSENSSLMVQVARAKIAALRTTSDPDARFSAKTQLVRNLYTLGYSSDTIREAFRLIDWMMHLRSDLNRRFNIELIAYEEELRMPYVTSIERLGIEKGREEGMITGREQGSVLLLLRQLNHLCGPIPEELEQVIRKLSWEQSQDLGEALLGFQSVADLNNWLQAIQNQNGTAPR